MAKAKKDTKTYVVTRKHVSLRDDNGADFTPEVGAEVELTDHQASRVVNKVRLKDDGTTAGPNKAEAKLTAERDALAAKVAELETLVQSQAAEIAKAAKA